MDLKQITYILTIAEERNITRAAEKLYITQSGLNQSLLKIERELGTPLFYRSRNELLLTDAGSVYIEYAKKIMQMKAEAYDMIHDISNSRIGKISIGLTAERGGHMFTNVFNQFKRAFPNVTIHPKEINVKTQISMIESGHLDIGFLTIPDHSCIKDECIHLSDEDFLLAVPANHPLAKTYVNTNTANLNDFSNEEFVIMYKDSSLRTLIDSLFEQNQVIPKILFETSNNKTMIDMVNNGNACTLIPRIYAQPGSNIRYFFLPSAPSIELVAVYRKGRYLNKAGEHLIELAKNYWKSYPYYKI